MENYILGRDLANEHLDQTCICIQFTNTCLEEMKELWSIGDEYPITEYYYKRFRLNQNNKLIISSIYENDNKDVFVNMLVK
jgi:hypothetical protein